MASPENQTETPACIQSFEELNRTIHLTPDLTAGNLRPHISTAPNFTTMQADPKDGNIHYMTTANHPKFSPSIDKPYPKIRAQPLAVWLGGPYAILLQLAHPGIAAASCAHSRFVTEGISRLRRTAAYIICLTHGTEREQKLIAGQITKQHSFIRTHIGHCPYDARDPKLQKWVAATLFKGMVLTDEVFTSAPESWVVKACQRLGIKAPRIRMGRVEKESLLSEASCFATSLDMPVDMWLSSLEEFETYFEMMVNGGISLAVAETFETHLPSHFASPELTISETSMKMGHALLFEMRLPFWLGFWLRPLMRLLVRAWLPDGLRKGFGLEGLGLDETGDGQERAGYIKHDMGSEIPEPGGDLKLIPWMTCMRCTYIALVWSVWLVDWLMPAWLEAGITWILVRDMKYAAQEIERTGRWPM
ncbi:DUF2236 domain containing protein [Naviculisporaceae sp. PSN 640]